MLLRAAAVATGMIAAAAVSLLVSAVVALTSEVEHLRGEVKLLQQQSPAAATDTVTQSP